MRRKENKPKAVQDLLAAAVGKPEVMKAIRVMRLCRNWADIVGETLANKSKPMKYSQGVLIVHVASSVWALEMRFHAESIRQRINQKLGEEVLREVRFKEGPTDQDHAPVDSTP